MEHLYENLKQLWLNGADFYLLTKSGKQGKLDGFTDGGILIDLFTEALHCQESEIKRIWKLGQGVEGFALSRSAKMELFGRLLFGKTEQGYFCSSCTGVGERYIRCGEQCWSWAQLRSLRYAEICMDQSYRTPELAYDRSDERASFVGRHLKVLELNDMEQAVLTGEQEEAVRLVTEMDGLLEWYTPETAEQIRGRMLSKDTQKTCSWEKNYFSAAQRLGALLPERPELVEWCLQFALLAEPLSQKQTGSVINRLCTILTAQQDIQRLKQLLDYYPESRDGSVHAQSHYCRTLILLELWDELEDYLRRFPALANNLIVSNALRQAKRDDSRPSAFWGWLGIGMPEANPVEKAILELDMDELQHLAADQETMEQWGYSGGEQKAILECLTQSHPAQDDLCAQGLRLMAIQGNQNRLAEYLLWSALPAPKAYTALLDYYAQHDMDSFLWMAERYKVHILRSQKSLYQYINCLAKQGDHKTLADFMLQYPESWIWPDVLRQAVETAGEEEQEQAFWSPLLQWSLEHPVLEACPFEEAILQENYDFLQESLADGEKMEGWGYSPEQQQHFAKLLEDRDFAQETDLLSVFKRLQAFQGNTHRYLESFLHAQLNSNRDWALRQLFHLLVSEERWVEAKAYYEAYPVLQNNEVNATKYLWCLLRLEEWEQLLDKAEQVGSRLQKDRALAEEICQVARRLGRSDYADKLRAMLEQQPLNPFEECLIHYNRSELQQLISEPRRLAELGYTPEEIDHFADRIRKPFAQGKDPFSIASRVGFFLGIDRAEQFYLQAVDDIRAVRELFNIYQKKQSWDELCYLYRDHLHDLDGEDDPEKRKVWKPHHENIYYSALFQASEPENCQELVHELSRSGEEKPLTPEQQWRLLTALHGAQRTDALPEQERNVLENRIPFTDEQAGRYLDALWNSGEREQQEQAVHFAARLAEQFAEELSQETERMLASVGGHIAEEEQRKEWLAWLEGRDCRRMLELWSFWYGAQTADQEQLLKAYVDGRVAHLGRFDPVQGDLKQLKEAQSLLTNERLDHEQRARIREKLIQSWDVVLTERKEEVLRGGCEELCSFFETVPLEAEQLDAFLDMVSGYIRGLDLEQTDSEVLTGCRKLANGPQLSQQQKQGLIDVLLEEWLGLLETRKQRLTPQQSKSAAEFLKGAKLDRSQLEKVLERVEEAGLLDDLVLCVVFLDSCGMEQADLAYRWLKKLLAQSGQQNEQRRMLLGWMMKIVLRLRGQLPCAPEDLELLYEACVAEPSTRNLKLYYEACLLGERKDEAEMLLILNRDQALRNPEEGLTEAEAYQTVPTVRQWLQNRFEQQSVERLQQQCRRWAPLLLLNEQDQQTRMAMGYLGMSAPASEASQESVARLLLSDIDHADYLKCYLRTVGAESAPAQSKINYMLALKFEGLRDDAIQTCLENKQYQYAVRLLCAKMSTDGVNSAPIGQLLGRIFGEENLREHPELLDQIQLVFLGILEMNKRDPQGEWKNLGRAIHIAITAKRENLFFECFGSVVFERYKEKCAVVIANLFLTDRMEEGKRWLSQALRNGDNHYLQLLSRVAEQYDKDGALSPESRLLAMSIPRDGNSRSMELYGWLVDYALDQGWGQPCAAAFDWMFRQNPNDRALASCCIQLFGVSGERDLKKLYSILLAYHNIAPDSFTYRVAQALIVVRECMQAERIYVNDDLLQLYAQRSTSPDKGRHHTELMELGRYCRDFIHSSGQPERAQKILLFAATGWWRLEHGDVYLLRNQITPVLLRRLVGIYSIAFAAGCLRLALLNQGDQGLLQEIQTLLEDNGLPKAKRAVGLLGRVGMDRVQQLADVMDAPFELPNLYGYRVVRVMESGTESQIGPALEVLLSCQTNFTYSAYQADMLQLQPKVEARCPQHSLLIRRLLTNLSVLDKNEGKLLHPGIYVGNGDYMTGYFSAENMKPGMNATMQVLKKAYMDLCAVMTGQMQEKDIERLGLADFLNMTNVLCQTPRYRDLDKLLQLCDYKWQICIRCHQEIIQGDPRSVFQVLEEPAMKSHDGCCAAIRQALVLFINFGSKNSDPNKLNTRKIMQRENLQWKRDLNWGLFRVDEVPDVFNSSGQKVTFKPFLIAPSRRNYWGELNPLMEDLRPLLEAMAQKDEENLRLKQERKESQQMAEVYKCYQNCRSIPYVTDAVEQYLEEQEQQGQEEMGEMDRVNLQTQLVRARKPEKRAEYLIRLLAADWTKPADSETCSYCFQLGLALFDSGCVQEDLYAQNRVTPEARETLYQAAKCLPGVPYLKNYSEQMKHKLLLCLESYTDLSEMVRDCNRKEIMDLSAIITDELARLSIQQHIEMVRETGQILSKIMTVQEKVGEVKKLITRCRAEQNLIAGTAKQNLIRMLNRLVESFSGLAQVAVTVYNQTASEDNQHIFGKIENLGGQTVTNVKMELQINGVLYQRYHLNRLHAHSIVPFEIEFELDEELEQVPYRITAQFLDGEQQNQQIQPVEGVIRMEEPEDYVLHSYPTDAPADEATYCERANVLKSLNSHYPEGRRFYDFPNLAIYGMRRTGKSSILGRLQRMLQQRYGRTVLTVQTTAEGASANDENENYIVRDVLIIQVLNGLEASMKGREGWREFADRWSSADVSYSDIGGLYDFYRQLKEDWLGEQNLIVIVDEVENLLLVKNAQEGVNSAAVGKLLEVLSKITQSRDALVRFVFCGSDYFTNCMQEGDHLTQFFQRMSTLKVGRMDYAEIERAMKSLEDECELVYEQDAIQYLWSITGGLPWHSKKVGNAIIEQRLNPECRNVVYPSDILWGVETILGMNLISSDDNYGLIALDADERRIKDILVQKLSSPVMTVSESELYDAFCEQIGEDKNAQKRFDRATKTLVSERQMVSRKVRGGEQSYQFGCELYRLYNCRKNPDRFLLDSAGEEM